MDEEVLNEDISDVVQQQPKKFKRKSNKFSPSKSCFAIICETDNERNRKY